MKEFEKWLDKHPGRYTIPALQMGWRAALEWGQEVIIDNPLEDLYCILQTELDGRPR